MKLDKTSQDFRVWEFKIVLPKIEPPICSKKTVTPSSDKVGSVANKENKFQAIVLRQPKINLYKIDTVRVIDSRLRSDLKIKKSDEKLLPALNDRNISYSKINSIRLEKTHEVSMSRCVEASESKFKSFRRTDTIVTKKFSSRIKQNVMREITDTLNHNQPKLNQKLSTNHFEKVFGQPSLISTMKGLEIMLSPKSHKCEGNCKHEINSVQIEGIKNGCVRQEYSYKVKQQCISRPHNNSVLKKTTSVISTATKKENYQKSNIRSKKDVSILQTTGINVCTRKSGIEKSCTKIVESKYEETVIQKIHEDDEFIRVTRARSAAALRYNPPSHPVSSNQSNVEVNPSTKSQTKSKKKLNVSFKVVDSPPKSTRILRSHRGANEIAGDNFEQNLKTTKNTYLQNLYPGRKTNKRELASDNECAGNVPFTRSKKRMKKSEALVKTEKFNEKQRILKQNIEKRTPQNAKTKDNSFSRNKFNLDFSITPNVLLEKLDETIVSTYSITPLRGERTPIRPKTTYDYGIDDVNTDDSTDDENCPKKALPEWVKDVKRIVDAQFYTSSALKRSWMRPPKKKFTFKSLFT